MATSRMAPTVQLVQSRIGYTFKDTRLLWEALQAPGSILRSGEISGAGSERHSVGFQRLPDGNRRLALVGDSVLKLALVKEWYKGTAVRERLYRVVADVGSNVNLTTVGRRNGLDMLINKNPSDKSGPVGHITVAATVEAIIGAVYLDGDMVSVTQVMQNLGLVPRLARNIRLPPKNGTKVPVSEGAESPAVSHVFETQ